MNVGIVFLVIISVVILGQLITLSQSQRKRHKELIELFTKLPK